MTRARTPGLLSRAPEHRQVTVLSCDMVNSTALTRQLGRESYSELLAEFITCVRNAISKNGGYEHETRGDCVYALFGYPLADETAAENAVRAALSLLDGLKKSSLTNHLHAHIGVATSMLLIGSFTDQDRQDAIGDAMNLVARLMDLGQPDSVLVADETRSLVGDIFLYERLSRLNVNGYENPLVAWRVITERASGTRYRKLREAYPTPLLGRKFEWATLLEHWRSARQGQGKVAIISGESGIGKSRLVHDLAGIAERDDGHISFLQCEPHLKRSHLGPVAAHLNAAAEIQPGERPEIQLAKLHGFARRRLGDPSKESLALLAELLFIQEDVDLGQHGMSSFRHLRRLLETVVDLLISRAETAPLLLVIEDIHWADDSTLELIGQLVRRVLTTSTLLLVTIRGSPRKPFEPDDQIIRLPLLALTDEDGLALVHALTAAHTLPDVLVREILIWSEGLPLDIEEHTREELLAWSQRFEGVAGATARVGDPGHIQVPFVRRDALKALLDRLSEDSQRVVRAAATIGQEFSSSHLQAVLRIDDQQLDPLLGELEESTIAKRDNPNTDIYRFRHARHRDTAYETMLREERIEFHARTASFLSEHHPELAETRPELLAHHLERADKTEAAIHYWIEAGNRSLRRAAYLESVTQFEKAVALLDSMRACGVNDALLELSVRIPLGAAYEVRDGFSCSNAEQQYERALEISRNHPTLPGTNLFAAYSGYGSFHIARGNFGEVLQIAVECLAVAQTSDSNLGRLIGNRLRGGALMLKGYLDAGMAYLKKSVDMYEQIPEFFLKSEELYAVDHKVIALCYLGIARVAKGEVVSALETMCECEDFAREHTNLHSETYAICYHAGIHHLIDNLEMTALTAERSLKMAVEQGYGSWEGMSRILLGDALLARGDIKQGQREFAVGRKIHEQGMEARLYLPFIISVAAKALARVGEYSQALETLTTALALAESTGELWYLPELCRLKGEVLAKLQELPLASEYLERSYNMALEQGAKLWALRALMSIVQLSLDKDKRNQALQQLRELHTELPQISGTTDHRQALGLLTDYA